MMSLALLIGATGLAGAQENPSDDPVGGKTTTTTTNTTTTGTSTATPSSNPYGGATYGNVGGQINPSETKKTAGEEETMVQPQPEAQATSPYVHAGHPYKPWEVMLGGGVADFTGSTMRNTTGTGGEWEARVGWQPTWVGLEAAYVGTAQNVDAIGLDTNAWLASNGVEGLLRVNLPTYYIQPFVFGGPSYVHYSIQNSSFNTSDISSNDDTFALPFGGGIAARLGNSGAMLDARFTYRPTWGSSNFIAGSSSNTQLNNWIASARIGWAF